MTRRLFACIAACILPLSAALAAPPLLLPHDGPVPKTERPRPFQSEGHRVQLNLDELRRLRPGDDVELRLPNGTAHAFVFDLLKDEGNGIVTWVGVHKGSRDKLRAVVTSGPAGSFGRISTPDGDYRLVPGEGFDWLVDMVAEQPHLPLIDLRNDALFPPPRPKAMHLAAAPEFFTAIEGVNTVAIPKATPSLVTVDLMVVYTPAYAANLGAGLQTRLTNLVAIANTMFADSEVGIVLRLVHSVQASYSDATGSSQALNDVSPPGGVDAAFANIETLRNQVGADMVTLLRNGSDFGGSGIAWVATGAMDAGFAPYTYSVVTGCVRGCESVWVHELGHNMGNMHDRATVAWDAGGTSILPQGSSAYSYGYYSCTNNTLSCNPNVAGGCATQPECSTPRSGTNNFADVMAYFHGTTVRNMKFSNPNVTCAGVLGIQMPCGIPAGQPGAADAARSMNENRIALSALKATAVSAPGPARLGNLSTRMRVLTGNDVMIGGFVIGGTASKTVVVRARGPSLVPFGIANALADPQLQLVRSSDQATIAFNNDWLASVDAAAISASGFAPGNSRESAILATLPPGAYTAIVSGIGGGTGVGIVEVFEVDAFEVPLVNIATRGQVLTGNDVMIGGFVIQGDSPRTVVVRARGPSLVPFGIANALANPQLQLVRSSDQATLATNNDWQSASNAAAITASGFAPSNSLEAAILITLPPGAYTAIVSGAGGGTGVGIVEVFVVP